MKCTSCGLPLSPSRTATYCPRCGASINSGQKSTSSPAQPLDQQANWGIAGVVDAGVGTPPTNNPWAQNVKGFPTNSPSAQPADHEQIRFSGPVSRPEYPPVSTHHGTPPPSSRNTNLGFVVAGLCIFSGGVILVFVYFLAIGSAGSSSSNPVTTTSIPSAISTPTAASTTTATLSPTPTVYPGQQYIDNAQTAANVDQSSLQPSQPSTTFKIGQRIYISFHLHPPGHGGVVCVNWYLNSKQTSTFPLPVNATSRYSYAYNIFGVTGPAYVELYWASTTQCTDQVLAQHVDFTVTN